MSIAENRLDDTTICSLLLAYPVTSDLQGRYAKGKGREESNFESQKAKILTFRQLDSWSCAFFLAATFASFILKDCTKNNVLQQ